MRRETPYCPDYIISELDWLQVLLLRGCPSSVGNLKVLWVGGKHTEWLFPDHREAQRPLWRAHTPKVGAYCSSSTGGIRS